MITDNQAREAIKSIAEYCKQHRFCYIVRIDKIPEDWAKYVEATE